MSNRLRSRMCRAGARVLLLVLSTSLMACGAAAPVAPAAVPRAGGTTEGAEGKPPSDAVRVRFEAERPDQRWSLLSADEKVVCDLPCTRWVGPSSGMFLQYEQPGWVVSTLRVNVPGDLGPPGSSVGVVARSARETARTGTWLEITSVPVAVLGAVVFMGVSRHNDALDPVAVASLGVTAGICAVLLGAGIYLRAVSHPADAELRPAAVASSKPTLQLRPGFLEAASAGPAGFHGVLTPLGAAGTF